MPGSMRRQSQWFHQLLERALSRIQSRDKLKSFGCTILTRSGRHIEAGFLDGERWVNVDGRRVWPLPDEVA